MRPSGIILGLISAVHITAQPLDYTTAAEIFKRDQPTVQPRQSATQSCHATNHVFFNAYSILIRVPYGGDWACDDTYLALENGIPLSNWQCVETPDGYIQIWFNCAPFLNDSINSILESLYPSVNSFNCPGE